MDNPIIDLLHGYDAVPISAVIVTLARPAGQIGVQIVRCGGDNVTLSPGDTVAAGDGIDRDADNRWRMGLGPRPRDPVFVGADGVTTEIWFHAPDIWRTIDGEYFRHEIDEWMRQAARALSALDIICVNEAHWRGPTRVSVSEEIRWHIRPCNPKHWRIVKIGRRSVRILIPPGRGKNEKL